jgi:hypothetical protein
MSNSVNNLNIFTFIKDIYQSLKNIDKYFNDSNININSRLTKIEDNQLIILDKLSSIEIFLNKLNESNTTNVLLNKNIENELLEKMKIMNSNNLNNIKVNLKPEELTFENILENNYTISDINKSLLQSNIENNLDLDLNTKNLNKMIYTDFKSSSSGSSYYNRNSNSNSNSNNNSNSNINNNYSTNENNNKDSVGISDGISDCISDNLDNLNNLLF